MSPLGSRKVTPSHSPDRHAIALATTTPSSSHSPPPRRVHRARHRHAVFIALDTVTPSSSHSPPSRARQRHVIFIAYPPRIPGLSDLSTLASYCETV